MKNVIILKTATGGINDEYIQDARSLFKYYYF